jgi:hypothetical protein
MSTDRGIFVPKNSGQIQPENLYIQRRNKLRRHSTVVSNVIIRGYHHVSDHAKMTYLALDSYDWPDENGQSKGNVWPSMSTLATDRGKSRLSILRDIQELAEAGLVTVESGKERGVPNLYWIEDPSEEEVEKYLQRYVRKPVDNLVEFTGRDSTSVVESEKAVSNLIQGGISSLKHPPVSNLKHEGIESESITKKTKDSNQRTGAKTEKSNQKYSSYVSRVMEDFSRELRDPEHIESNKAQANNLFRQSSLSEKEFVDLMYEARRRTGWQVVSKAANAEQSGLRNRCPYFFKVLRDLLEEKNKL